MARARMTEEIVETLYPLYDAEMQGLIARVYAVHKEQANIEERLIDAIWVEGYAEFRARNIEASRGNAETLALAERGELTADGRAAIRAYLDEAQEYHESLLNLSNAEMAARYDEVCGTAESSRQVKRRERGQQADLLAFFNRANATADFARWRAFPVWSADEATALSFGKDPRIVNVATLREYLCIHGSPFRDEYIARLDQIERALRFKKLREPLQPTRFIKRAIDHRIETAPELIAGSPTTQKCGAELDVREVHTLYKVLLGLAIKHYNFDPTLEDRDEQAGVFDRFVADLEDVEQRC